MARTKTRRRAGGDPWKAAREREAELRKQLDAAQIENRVLADAREEIAKRYEFERGKTSDDVKDARAEAKRWQESAQRMEQVMLRRVEDAQRDVGRYLREIEFLRETIHRITTGSQLEQTFTVVTSGGNKGTIS